ALRVDFHGCRRSKRRYRPRIDGEHPARSPEIVRVWIDLRHVGPLGAAAHGVAEGDARSVAPQRFAVNPAKTEWIERPALEQYRCAFAQRTFRTCRRVNGAERRPGRETGRKPKTDPNTCQHRRVAFVGTDGEHHDAIEGRIARMWNDP